MREILNHGYFEIDHIPGNLKGKTTQQADDHKTIIFMAFLIQSNFLFLFFIVILFKFYS